MHEGSVITVAEDLTREAQKIWNALRIMVDQEIDKRTASCVRSRKMTVMAAPNGSTIGVAEPFGETVYIPYSSTLANAKVGDSVWVDWKFNNASTMVAMATGEGQIVPDYMEINESNRNLLEARKFIQSGLTSEGDLETPTADTVPMDYTGIGSSNYYIHVKPSTNYRLTLFDTRIETESASCVVAQYASNGAFISLAASGFGWREPQGMTFVTNVNASFLRLSLVGFPKYRWKLEKGDISTDWQPSPEDASPYAFDSAPTINSQNPVTSGGIFSALQGKQDSLTFDPSPTSGSLNPVTSDGIYTALQDKQDTLTFDTAPTSGSTNPVQSGGIYSALGDKVDKSGDTMTGSLKVPNLIAYDPNWPILEFATSADSATIGGVWEDVASRRVVLRQIHSSGYYEDYILPGNGASDANATYDVITSKGGTMTGTLNTPTTRIYDSSTPMLSFISAATDSSALAAIYSQIANRNMVLRTRGTSGYVEDYKLPDNTTTNAHVNYNILTTKDGVLAYSDETVSVSLSANTWTEMIVTQQVAPSGYTALTRTIADGSTTAIRGYLFLVPNNMGNTAHILLYATQAVSGTFTLRTWFVRTEAVKAV